MIGAVETIRDQGLSFLHIYLNYQIYIINIYQQIDENVFVTYYFLEIPETLEQTAW